MTANPTLLSMPLAQNGQKNVIPATQATAGDGLFSQSTGFPAETSLPLGAGGVAPSREDFNGLANLLGGVAFMSQKGFTFNYDATQDYYTGCVVIDPTDGKRYECIADMPVADTIAPHSDTNNDYWKAFSLGGVPVGFIMPYAGTGLAEGFLDCDGAEVSRTTYAALYAVIGTKYGSGDGSTTFNLPDLIGKYPQGDTTAGTVKSAGLPNITGSVKFLRGGLPSSPTGAFSAADNQGNNSAPQFNQNAQQGSIDIDASRSSAIYGNSDTVTPPTLTVRYMIKYA